MTITEELIINNLQNSPKIFRWICIYPAYLNSKKTLAEGRRLPKKYCVENPTHQEIRDVLVTTGLRVGVENKLYPREKSKVPNLMSLVH